MNIRCYSEHSIVSLALEIVRNRAEGTETVLEHLPVGEGPENGVIERGARTLEGME